jgi:hypothetical protein
MAISRSTEAMTLLRRPIEAQMWSGLNDMNDLLGKAAAPLRSA